MKYCNKCQVTIQTNHDYCPLCHQTLETVEKEDLVEKYPQAKSQLRAIHNPLKKIILFISLTAIIVLLVTNYLTGFHQPWSLIPIGGIVFFWMFMTLGIFSKNNIASKLLFLTIATILFVYMIDELSYSEGWALNYVMPLMLFSCNIGISLMILIKRINYRDYISYLLLIVVFSLAPMVLIVVNVIDVLWPAITSFGLAIFILLLIIFFFPKSIKDEIKKRFHA